MNFKQSVGGVHYSLLLLIVLTLTCTSNHNVYKNDCDSDKLFYIIPFDYLIDSIAYYNGRYVEVTGKYKAGFEESALYNGSFFSSKSEDNAIWVNFNHHCRLVQLGKKKDMFGSDQDVKMLCDKMITLRGKVNSASKGHLSQYAGSIDSISMVKLK